MDAALVILRQIKEEIPILISLCQRVGILYF